MIKWYKGLSDYNKEKFWWRALSVSLTVLAVALFATALVFFLVAAWTVDPHLQNKLCATGGVSILASLGVIVGLPASWSKTW